MVVRIGVAGRDVLARHHVDGHAVLGVHHDQPAVLRGLLHGPEDRAVVAEEDARVGGEQLEGGHALVDERVHLGQDVVADVADDHVEAVVDAGLAIGLLMPGVEPLAQRAAARLHGEVDDGGGPAEGGGARPGLEGVLGEGAAERQLHVGVHVDRAGDDPLARCVDGAIGRRLQVGPDQRDRLAVDQHVGPSRGVGVDDRPALDQRAHRLFLSAVGRFGTHGTTLPAAHRYRERPWN